MTVREFIDLLDDWNKIVVVNTVENGEWIIKARTLPRFLDDDILDSRLVAWGVYDDEIAVRIF